MLSRLEQYAKQKEFRTHAVVFTGKDRNLNKAHVKYLEARLLELARKARRAEPDNGNLPQLPVLSKADAADVEGFLADMLLCLPVVGVKLLEKPKSGTRKSQDLFLKSKDIEARGVNSAEGFVARRGSQAVKGRGAFPPCLPHGPA